MPGIGRGGHCRNRIRVNTHIIVGGGSGIRRGAVGSGARSDIGTRGSGRRRDSVGGIQSHARGGGSGQGVVVSALRNTKGRGRGGGRRLGSGRGMSRR